MISRLLKAAILANVVATVLFCYFNWANWTLLNTELGINAQWSPFLINVGHPNGAVGLLLVLPNYPLILFFLSTIANLYFIINLEKTNKTTTPDKE